MIVTLVAAVARNGVIGSQGKLPWHISADLKRFKQITTGHTVVMGRKTYESIGRPLPHRRNLVLTRSADWPTPAGVEVFSSLGRALDACRQAHETEAFVIGGGEIYREALPLADRLLITEIPQQAVGDTHFPSIDPQRWEERARETTPECAFVEYRKRENR